MLLQKLNLLIEDNQFHNYCIVIFQTGNLLKNYGIENDMKKHFSQTFASDPVCYKVVHFAIFWSMNLSFRETRVANKPNY